MPNVCMCGLVASLANILDELGAVDEVKTAPPVLDVLDTSKALQSAAATFAGVVRLEQGSEIMMGDMPAQTVAPHLAHHFSLLVAMFEGSVEDSSNAKRRLIDSTPGVQESVRAAQEAAVSKFATVVAAIRRLEEEVKQLSDVRMDSPRSFHSGSGDSLFGRKSLSSLSMFPSSNSDDAGELRVNTGVSATMVAVRAVRRARAAVNQASSSFQSFETSCWVSVPMLLEIVPIMAKAKVSLGEGACKVILANAWGRFRRW